MAERNSSIANEEYVNLKAAIQITPRVWKNLILASQNLPAPDLNLESLRQSLVAAQRLLERYLEHRAGRKLKSLDLLSNLVKS